MGTFALLQTCNTAVFNSEKDTFEKAKQEYESVTPKKYVTNAPDGYLHDRFFTYGKPTNLYYQLMMAGAVDNAVYEKIDDNHFKFSMNTDKYDIKGTMNFVDWAPNSFDGKISLKDKTADISKPKELNYTAIIPADGSDMFKVLMTDDDDNSYYLSRNKSGQLALVDDNDEKFVLNKENAEKYLQKELKFKIASERMGNFDDLHAFDKKMLLLVLGASLLSFGMNAMSNSGKKNGAD